MDSRSDDEAVSIDTARRSAMEDIPEIGFPFGRADFKQLPCCSFLAPRISLEIDSVKVTEYVRQAVRNEEFASFRLRDYHPLRFRFPADSANKRISDSLIRDTKQSTTGRPRGIPDCFMALIVSLSYDPALFDCSNGGLGCSLFARRYLGNGPSCDGIVFCSSPY